MNRKPHIAIIGAGIGGLTAALALLRAGFKVDVYEQAEELAEVGAGFQVSSNGTRVLFALGLGDAIQAVAWQPKSKEIRLWNTGETWPLFDLGGQAVELYGFPYLMLHRADLHEILVNAVHDQNSSCVHLNNRCAGFDQTGDKVTVRFQNGVSKDFDAVIGADGVHSVIREALVGDDRPDFTGLVAWRGIVPWERVPEHLRRPVGTNWVGPGGHVIHYFLRRGELMNFVGFAERDDWQVESWSARGTQDECLTDFIGWHDDVRALIREIERPFKWALMLREPLEQWSFGRATLLGDACHPMLPMLAQGAVAAIEDGYVLARCFQAYDSDVETALRRYEAARMERTALMVRGSADNARRFHDPILAKPQSAAAFVDEQWQPDRIKDRYEWLFTYDATSVAI